jgi:hypothetical protein
VGLAADGGVVHTKSMRISTSLGFALLASLLAVTHARAEDRAGKLQIGVGAFAISPIHRVCETKGDASDCNVFHFYGGGDLSTHYYLTDWLALGGRASGGRNFDTTRDASNLGESETDERWLWRFAAEARLHPPILPVWIAGEVGAGFVHETWSELAGDNATGTLLSRHSETQSALLLGVASGLDLHLSSALLLTLEARVELLPFGDPPHLTSSVRATDLGTAPWVGLGARLSYLF